jgi:hypothetical protein
MAGVEGLTPGRESRGEERGVNKSDAVGKGGGGNKSMGCSRGLGRGKIKVPEASVGGAGTREQQGGVAMNVKASGREGCRTAVIAQLTDGEERMGSEPRKNVGLAGGRGETREVQGGNVAGAEDRAIRDTDGEAGVGWVPVRVRAVDRNVVACAAGVGNGRGVGTRRGGDYRRVKTSNMIERIGITSFNRWRSRPSFLFRRLGGSPNLGGAAKGVGGRRVVAVARGLVFARGTSVPTVIAGPMGPAISSLREGSRGV